MAKLIAANGDIVDDDVDDDVVDVEIELTVEPWVPTGVAHGQYMKLVRTTIDGINTLAMIECIFFLS